MTKYLLNCFIVILNSILCFLLLHKKYNLKNDKIVLKIIFIVFLVLIKLLITLLRIPPLNLILSYSLFF